MILCGNKDNLKKREVSKEEGEEFAKNEGINFFEVCSQFSKNIKNMFYHWIVDLLFLKEK